MDFAFFIFTVNLESSSFFVFLKDNSFNALFIFTSLIYQLYIADRDDDSE